MQIMVIVFINSNELLKSLSLVINTKGKPEANEKSRYARAIIRQSACLVVSPITLDSYVFLCK